MLGGAKVVTLSINSYEYHCIEKKKQEKKIRKVLNTFENMENSEGSVFHIIYKVSFIFIDLIV